MRTHLAIAGIVVASFLAGAMPGIALLLRSVDIPTASLSYADLPHPDDPKSQAWLMATCPWSNPQPWYCRGWFPSRKQQAWIDHWQKWMGEHCRPVAGTDQIYCGRRTGQPYT